MKIIAHRGANKYAPQNTIPAFKKALEIGCDGFENDVHLTKDGAIVVCHNYSVNATSNGEGEICDMTLEELRALDFGSYFSPDFKDTRIPLLSEFFELCGGLDIINVEIKTPPHPNGLVKKVIDMAKNSGLFDSLLISCFTPDVLIECKEYDPAVKVALLYDSGSQTYPEVSKDPVDFCKKLNCAAVHPHYSEVTEDYIKAFHEAGIAVNPWTVDDPEIIANLLKWDCDSVITNVPDIAGKVING